MTFRHWQEGPGYDRNLTKPTTILAAIDYIHLNPVRRAFVPAGDRLAVVECPLVRRSFRNGFGLATIVRHSSRMVNRHVGYVFRKHEQHCWTSQQWHPATGFINHAPFEVPFLGTPCGGEIELE